jgi:hypothetical protein
MLGLHGGMEILVIWKQIIKSLLMGMCTTSVECKIVITTVLTVKSGMDPHMISQEFWLVWEWFGLGWFWLGLAAV